MIFSANSVHLIILCIICYRQRESIVTCKIVVIPMNSRSIVLTCIKSLLLFNHCICTFDFFTFVSCLLTVTLHIVDVRLTCLINITYLLTNIFCRSFDSSSHGQLGGTIVEQCRQPIFCCWAEMFNRFCTNIIQTCGFPILQVIYWPFEFSKSEWF